MQKFKSKYALKMHYFIEKILDPLASGRWNLLPSTQPFL